MTRTHWVLLGLLLFLGFSLRFHALDRQSLWDDEMSTRKSAYLPISIWPAHFRTYECHPPLYFLQLKAWEAVCGSTVRSQRANAAAWGSVGLVVMFVLARSLYGIPLALIALALLALSPYHLAYSQEMRPYAMAITLGLLGFLAVRQRYSRIWLVVIFAAECYTHYWGAFLVLAQVLYGWLHAESNMERRRLLGCGVVAGVMLAGWWPILRDQLFYMKGLSFWVPPASPLNLAKTAIVYTGLQFNHASMVFEAPGPAALHWIIGGMAWALALVGFKYRSRLPLVWLLVGLGIPFMLSYYRPGIYVWYRYPSLVYPAFVLAVVSGLSRVSRSWLRYGLLSGLVLMSSWSCLAYKTHWQKANPKAVAAYVQDISDPQTTLVRPAYFAPLLAYYVPNRRNTIDQDQLDRVEKRAQLGPGPIIFIAFDVPYDPVRDAMLSEFKVLSSRYFPGEFHLGVTVYQLKGR